MADTDRVAELNAARFSPVFAADAELDVRADLLRLLHSDFHLHADTGPDESIW